MHGVTLTSHHKRDTKWHIYISADMFLLCQESAFQSFVENNDQKLEIPEEDGDAYFLFL